ncbi:hypothetical protein CPB85DRAFT_1443354 [Mucidula mucida]|nr:hypothetical protein CPB85DRAFT_1443354 [Mucidula mucida]
MLEWRLPHIKRTLRNCLILCLHPLPRYPPPETFLHFPDTHLDESLTLKRICILPSIFDDTLRSFETLFPSAAQAEISDAMFFFPTSTYSDLTTKYDAVDVREAYVKGVAFACTQVVSGVMLHPDDPTAIPIIAWDANPFQFTKHNSTFHGESFVLAFRNKLEGFTAGSQERIRSVVEHFPVLAIGMMLCPNGEWCLKEMDTLAPAEEQQFSDFPWVVNSVPTGHAPTPTAVRSADAKNSIWQLPSPPPPTTSTLRRSARYGPSSRKSVKRTSPTNFKPKDIHPAPPRPILAAELIQRAWVKAVRFDVSVILFDCGNFLRIGIRHRETQTLYLSSLIDVGNPDSEYGRLMLGLHFCIVHDVLARLPHAHPSAGDERNLPQAPSRLSRRNVVLTICLKSRY